MGKKRWDEATVIAAIRALAAKNGCAKCLVCARKECSFYKRANAENRKQYAQDCARIEEWQKKKYSKEGWL